MTLAEKILAAHAGRHAVSPGEFISARVDLVMSTDATGFISIRQFEKMGGRKVFDPQKVVMVMDHFVPPRDLESAETIKALREFAARQGILFYDVGRLRLRAAGPLPYKRRILDAAINLARGGHERGSGEDPGIGRPALQDGRNGGGPRSVPHSLSCGIWPGSSSAPS